MAVVDILRDRERGMVRYNQARRQYGLQAFTKFEELTDNADVSPALSLCYAISIFMFELCQAHERVVELTCNALGGREAYRAMLLWWCIDSTR